MVVEDLRVAVGLHADAATGCSGNVLLALLHEVADQPVVTEHDRFNLEKGRPPKRKTMKLIKIGSKAHKGTWTLLAWVCIS